MSTAQEVFQKNRYYYKNKKLQKSLEFFYILNTSNYFMNSIF